MSVLGFERSEQICIVDKNGEIVRLNDQARTVLWFDASKRLEARRMLHRLNNYRPAGLNGPYRLLPLADQPVRP